MSASAATIRLGAATGLAFGLLVFGRAAEAGTDADSWAQANGSTLAPARIVAGNHEIPYVGGSVDVMIDTIGVTGLGAATLIAGYEPAILEVTGCARGPAFDFGLCNAKHDRDGDGTPDAVRFNVVSIEGRSGTADDPLELASISFKGVGAAGSRSALELQVLTFTDTEGKPLQSAAENGWIEIGHAPSPTPGPSPTPPVTPGASTTPGVTQHFTYLPYVSKP